MKDLENQEWQKERVPVEDESLKGHNTYYRLQTNGTRLDLTQKVRFFESGHVAKVEQTAPTFYINGTEVKSIPYTLQERVNEARREILRGF
ncbi:MAG: hypothetical protein ABIH82_03790 [Candidatus Woesearchaeota archaeon]